MCIMCKLTTNSQSLHRHILRHNTVGERCQECLTHYNQEMDLPTTGASSGTKALRRVPRMGTKALHMEHQQVRAVLCDGNSRDKEDKELPTQPEADPHADSKCRHLYTPRTPLLPCKEESSLKKRLEIAEYDLDQEKQRRMAESNTDIIRKRLQEKEKEPEAERKLSISYEKEVQMLKEQIQSFVLCSTPPPLEPLDDSAHTNKTNMELIEDWTEQHGVTAAQISQLQVINLHAEFKKRELVEARGQLMERVFKDSNIHQ